MLELLIAVFLILLNGCFALSELSIVSARKPRLKLMAEQRQRGARAALQLSESPGRLLSTTQVGITLVGVLAGAFSGAALSERMTAILVANGVPGRLAGIVGYVIVIGLITFFSVVIGELVPKHMALKHPERLARLTAPFMLLLSRIAAPVVWLLDASSRLVLTVLGSSEESSNAVTDEEIRTVIAEAESAGVIETAEQSMISGVMRLGDRSVRAVMTPRTEVDYIDLEWSDEKLRKELQDATHSRLPVGEGGPDAIIGVVLLREMLSPLIDRRRPDLRALLRKAPVVPDTLDALDALRVLQESEVPMALVHDEFGHFEGLITPGDILDAIAGSFRSDEEGEEKEAVQREDGSWLLAGWMPADEMAELLYITLPPKRNYDTVAGLIINELQHIPETGAKLDFGGWCFEVVDLDGRRVDKVLATRKPE